MITESFLILVIQWNISQVLGCSSVSNSIYISQLMVKVKEYYVSHFRVEDFIGSFIPSTFNICYAAFSGE